MKKQNSRVSPRRIPKAELAKRLTKAQVGTDDGHSQNAELKTLLHELEVSQIELEVQNTELVESRRAVDESHDRYLDLYDFAPVGYMTLSKKGIIKELNLTASDLFGVERQRLLEHPLSPRILAADQERFRSFLSQCEEGQARTMLELNLLGSSGKVIPVQLLSTCARDKATGELILRTAITDLSDQKRAEQERLDLLNRIEAARKELFDFVMQAPAPMAILSGPEHIFTLANSHYEELSGKEVLNHPVRDIFTEIEIKRLLFSLDRVYQTGETYVGEEVHFSKNNQKDGLKDFYFNVSFSPLRGSDGQIKGILLYEQDVTPQVLARKKLEAEKEIDLEKQKELKRAKDEAERASQTKSAFLANMSHEIRTPLGAILGFTELLKESNSPSERSEYAEVIERNGKALTKLIDDVLDLSRVEAGRLQIEQMDFSVRELMAEMAGLFKEILSAKGVALNIFIDPEIPEQIQSDPTRLRQILVNLIGNSTKFTSQGSIDIEVKPISTNGSMTCLKFVIKDTGIGMSKSQAAMLFEPFSQADSSMTRKYGGSGLGLVLSRKLARALGGDVSLQDCSLAKGCVFSVFVEARPVSAQKDKSGELEHPVLLNTQHSTRVLLVEDSLDNQMLIKQLLLRAGMTVDVASNGAEGVEMAESNNYDVVLMDMQMPVLDGYGATERLRHDGYDKPIVALTAHAMVEERNRILALGCDAHLTKPVNSKLLIETIGRMQSSIH